MAAISASLWGIVVLAAIIILIVFLKKRFIALVVDLAIGSLLYFAIVVVIGFLGIIKLPPIVIDWGWPILLIIFTAWHIISNIKNIGPRNQPTHWGTF